MIAPEDLGPVSVPVQEVSPAEMVRSPFNREIDTKSPAFLELVANVQTHGVIQPLLCRPLPSAFDGVANAPGTPRLEIVFGERRWLAASAAKLTTVPVMVRALSDRAALELQTIENDQREDLSPIQQAEKYQQLLEQYGKDGLPKEKAMAELCAKLNKAKATVYEALRLTGLPLEVKELVSSNKLPPSHAGLVTKLPFEHQGMVAQALAPGKNISPERAREIYNLTGHHAEDEEDETGLVSFRNAKDMVDSVLDDIKKAETYEKSANAFREKGGTALTLSESRANADDYIGEPDYLSEFSNYVSGLVKSVKELPKKVMRPQRHSPDKSEMVYPKKQLIAALKKAGVKPRTYGGGGGSSTNYAKLERARKDRERIKKAVLGKIIAPIRSAAGKRNAKAPWPLFLSEILGYTAHAVCQTRGWKCDHRNYGEVLSTQVAKLPENQMAGVVADALVAKLTTQHTGSYQPGLLKLGSFYDVDVKAIEKETRKQLEPTAGKTKTQTEKKPKTQASGKAKATRAKPTAAGRLKLSEAMKARWAARRKDAKQKGEAK